MIGVMTLDEQWAGNWAADHAAELSATVAILGLQGRQSSSQVTSPCAEGPGASCSLLRTASCKMREPTGSCCLQVPFSSDIPRWKTSLLIIVGQENWKRLKVSWVHFWPRFLQKQSKRASWSPSRRKSYLRTSFQSSCWSLQGRTTDSSWQMWMEWFLLLIFYHPWYPLPPSIASLISQLSENTDLSRQDPYLTVSKSEVVSRSKHSMYKVRSGVCTIITLHVTQQILSQHLLCAKNSVLDA